MFSLPRVLLLALFGFGTIYVLSNRRPITPGAIEENPIQTTVENGKRWAHRGYHFTSLAGFELRARVVHRKRYRTGLDSELSPVDLAIAWGPISDASIYRKFRFNQHSRWYFWKNVEGYSESEVARHSANLHMIPAGPEVERVALKARAGDIIRLKGKLVQISGANDFTWVSSLSRDDTGARSCEVVWVDSLILEP